jgi:anti-repressor protein
MLSSNKNSEARQCANTNRASMSVTVCKETNMNIVAKSDYNFHGVELVPTRDMHGVWFTSSNIASALKYANSRAVTMIYNKYSDEFSAGMTQVLEVSTSGNYRKKVRVFSLRGAHLIAMFARTPVAKEFRRWIGRQNAHRLQNSLLTKNWLISATYNCGWRRVNKCANTSTQE